MFENIPRSTAFLSPDANAFFEGRIDGDSWCHDTVFMSTLRALMSRKMDQDPHIRVAYANRMGSNTSNSAAMYTAAVSMTNLKAKNTLYIVALNAPMETSYEILKAISERIDAAGFMEVKKVGQYYDHTKKIAARYYVNLAAQTGVLFLDKLTKPRLQCLASQIPTFLPWYFPDRASVTDQEMEMLKALSEPTYDHWLSIVEEIASHCDYRREYICKVLKGFEVSGDEQTIELKEAAIGENLTRIENARRQITEWYDKIREMSDLIAGIRKRMEEYGEGESPLMQFFINSKNLDIKSVSGRTLAYQVKSTVQIYDEFAAETYIRNLNSNVYAVPAGRKADLQRVLRAVFVDKTLKLRVCGAFQLTIGSILQAKKNQSFGPEYDTYLPNPHLQHYACTGGYDDMLDKLMQKNSFAAAVSQSILAAQTINWSDHTVMRSFGPDLIDSWSRKIFEKADGTLVSAEEFIREEKEKEE